MASRVDPQQGLMASVLDRLIDPGSAGTEAQPGYNLAQMMEAVRRDLEELLNTRQTLDPVARARERVRNSIVGYGLPDFTSAPVITPQQRQDVARALEEIIVRYEPRLRDVRVTPQDIDTNKVSTLRFRIEARLTVEPGPEVAFDTVTADSGQYSVSQPSVLSDVSLG